MANRFYQKIRRRMRCPERSNGLRSSGWTCGRSSRFMGQHLRIFHFTTGQAKPNTTYPQGCHLPLGHRWPLTKPFLIEWLDTT